MTLKITKNELSSYLVQYHSLDCLDRLAGEAGIKNFFRRTGSVQYDPLDIAGRNPHLVLQSRIKGFTRDMLEKLLYKDRFLVDAWDKEMSIYKTEEWPFFSRIRERREESARGTLERRGQEKALTYTARILKKLETGGPAMAAGIDLGKCRAGSWGHRNIAGAALDYLYARGEVGVYKKKNTQKVYDLIQNLIPEKILKSPEPFRNDGDFYEWYFLRRIKSIGVHWLKNGGGWNGFFLSDSQLRKKTFESLEKKGAIERIEIPGINESFYICQDDIKTLRTKPDYDNCVKFLAPLDNMLWDRDMVYKIFDFQYTWEVYVPAEKRKYGYYVLPVLYRDKLIARMETIKQKTYPLTIKNWWWEPDIKITNKLRAAVENGLKKFAEYLNLDGVNKEVTRLIFS
ncbi:MAG: winged helix DNA-binding domain-containing protein [Treponema sp.]|jgi:uncharacterized protein YcaQ|nr:winged helix DNA-binding domain-containing protein [Treponema sp.]